MGRTVAVVCPKGGVGKTTVTVNLGSALADKGFECLLIGVDPQCGLIGSFGQSAMDGTAGLKDLFERGGDPLGVVRESGVKNLSFIASNVQSRGEEARMLELATVDPGRLSRALESFQDRYDFLFLDCPPNLGPMTFAALQAADAYLVPMQAEELAYRALPRLQNALEELGRQGLPVPDLLGILLNQVDSRTRLAGSIIAQVREEHGDRVFRTMIPRTVRLGEVAQRGLPVDRFNRSGAAANAFANLAEEILAPMVDQVASAAATTTATAVAEAPVETAPPAVETAMEIEVADLQRLDRHSLLEVDPGESLRSGMEYSPALVPISLDELSDSEEEVSTRSRPSLDDYDHGGEEESLH